MISSENSYFKFKSYLEIFFFLILASYAQLVSNTKEFIFILSRKALYIKNTADNTRKLLADGDSTIVLRLWRSFCLLGEHEIHARKWNLSRSAVSCFRLLILVQKQCYCHIVCFLALIFAGSQIVKENWHLLPTSEINCGCSSIFCCLNPPVGSWVLKM